MRKERGKTKSKMTTGGENLQSHHTPGNFQGKKDNKVKRKTKEFMFEIQKEVKSQALKTDQPDDLIKEDVQMQM